MDVFSVVVLAQILLVVEHFAGEADDGVGRDGVVLSDPLLLDSLLEHGEPHGGAVLAPVEVLEPLSDLAKCGTDSGEVRALEGAGRGDTACVEVAASSCARCARRALLRTVEEVGGSIVPVASSVLRRIDLRVAVGAAAVEAFRPIVAKRHCQQLRPTATEGRGGRGSKSLNSWRSCTEPRPFTRGEGRASQIQMPRDVPISPRGESCLRVSQSRKGLRS